MSLSVPMDVANLNKNYVFWEKKGMNYLMDEWTDGWMNGQTGDSDERIYLM